MRCLLPPVAAVAVLASMVWSSLTVVVTYYGHTYYGRHLLVVRLAREIEPAAAAARLLHVEQAVSSGQLPRATPSTPRSCAMPAPPTQAHRHGVRR